MSEWACQRFFFFQAEDGIRDSSVTGVQTCALPISACRDPSPESDARLRALLLVVDRELRAMSEKSRSAYVLLREEGLSVGEAALVLGTTSAVVKQRAHRAYEQIRGALRAAGRDGGT